MAKKKTDESGDEITIDSNVEYREGTDFTKRVKLRALEGAPHHKVGTEFEAGEVLADKMVSKGIAELVK